MQTLAIEKWMTTAETSMRNKLNAEKSNFKHYCIKKLHKKKEAGNSVVSAEEKQKRKVGKSVMPIHSTDLLSDAVRRYFEAFPSLSKEKNSLSDYNLPPPLWCKKSSDTFDSSKMKGDILCVEKCRAKVKRNGKQRRNSYHGQRKRVDPKKRCNSFGRSFDRDEDQPEWLNDEEVWDLETHDPVKEFIRALALDHSLIACERVEVPAPTLRLDDDIELHTDWSLLQDAVDHAITPADEELYAKFEAKFDRSIEALWQAAESPSAGPASLAGSIWSVDGELALLDRLEPLRLDEPPPLPPGLRALNHSRDSSCFAEVTPRAGPVGDRRARAPPPILPRFSPLENDAEDPLTSARTHFRPIGRSPSAVRYADGATFQARESPPPTIECTRSRTGSVFVRTERYYETVVLPESRPLLVRASRPDKAVQTESPEAMAWQSCEECSRLSGAKKMRGARDIWSASTWCQTCAGGLVRGDAHEVRGEDDEWDDLLAAISEATSAEAAPNERKRRRCGPQQRPLTR